MLHKDNKYHGTVGTTSSGIMQNTRPGGVLLFREAELDTSYHALQQLITNSIKASSQRTAVRLLASRLVALCELLGYAAVDSVGLDTAPPRWDVPGWLDETLRLHGFCIDSPALYRNDDCLDSMMESDDNIPISASPSSLCTAGRSPMPGAPCTLLRTRA